MKKTTFVLLGLAFVAVALGALALTASPVSARACVQCPVIEDPTCPPCYELVPGTCTHCAYCKKIRGCH